MIFKTFYIKESVDFYGVIRILSYPWLITEWCTKLSTKTLNNSQLRPISGSWRGGDVRGGRNVMAILLRSATGFVDNHNVSKK
jgi:hypothetical protein